MKVRGRSALCICSLANLPSLSNTPRLCDIQDTTQRAIQPSHEILAVRPDAFKEMLHILYPFYCTQKRHQETCR